MHIETRTNETHITIRRDLSAIAIGAGVHVCKITTTQSSPGWKQPRIATVQGIAHTDKLSSIDLETPKLRSAYVLTDEVLTAVKACGVHVLAVNNYRDAKNRDVFDWLESGGSVENIITIKSDNHTFYRADGSLLPTGIYFDYIDARMHNGCYDLEKAREHLHTVDGVSFAKDEVQDIPWYNSDDGRERFLEFFWTPDQATYETLADSCGMQRYKTIFDNDLLGLRACGAALCADFYKDA